MATRWFAAILASVFFLLELIQILHHGMWEDEMQVWSFSQHSHSLSELHYVTRYEGHPEGWQLLVYFISQFSSNPFAMQLLHLAIATMTAYVVARYSPFSRLQKVLIVFGYFLFYEYAAISRDYALGVFGLFSFCAVFRPGPRKNYILLALLLALMAESNIYALILALSLALMILFEAMQTDQRRRYLSSKPKEIVCAAALFLAAVSISLLHMRPPADIGWNVVSDLSVRASKGLSGTLAMIWIAFVPIPRLSHQFWSSNFLGAHYRVMAVLSTLLVAVSVLFFIRKRTVLFLYLCGLGALCLFKKLVYTGTVRHDGHAFVLFLACMWLAKYYPEQAFPSRRVDKAAERLKPYQDGLLEGLLSVQVIAALVASVIALSVPFSQAKAVSAFLRANHMDHMFIIGDPDFAASSIAGYLNRDFYYPRGDRMGSYVLWDNRRTRPTEPILELSKRKAAERQQDVLVILNTRDASAQEIASFQGSIVAWEDYYVYLVQAEKPKANSSPDR